MGTAVSHCSAANMRDTNRLQLCGDVADTLARHGSTLNEHSAGLLIGRQAGWPADKIAAAEAERDAMRLVIRQQADVERNASACESGRAANRSIAVFADRGELGVVREAMRSGGKSVAELAEAYRAERRAAQKEATSAAAPAGGPPS